MSNEKKSPSNPSDDEFLKEITNLKPTKVNLSQVYLDPNNPRFQKSDIFRDDKIPELQPYCSKEMEKYNIFELEKSIKKSGFWIIDRVVLRPIKNGKYVVVEGNRRISALKNLYNKNEILKDLSEAILKGIEEFDVLIYEGNNPKIALIIQGFRHTPGIMGWEKHPKGEFLTNLEKVEKMSIKDIKSIFPGEDVTSLIRAHSAIKQAKSYEDYSENIDPAKDFGYFDEMFLASATIKDWASWDDNLRKFKKEENFKRLLRIIFIEKDKRNKPPVSIKTRDTLIKLLQSEYKELLEKLERGELSFNDCRDEIDEEEREIEPVNMSKNIRTLKTARKVAETLPIAKLQRAKNKEEKTQKEELLKLMKELVEILEQQIKNLENTK